MGLGDELSCCVAAMAVCPVRCSGCHKIVEKTSICRDGDVVMVVKATVVVVVVEKVMVMVVVLLILGQDMVILAQPMWWCGWLQQCLNRHWTCWRTHLSGQKQWSYRCW